MRLRTLGRLFAISVLLLVLTACSAVSAALRSAPPLGTTLLSIKNPFNVFTVAWSPNGQYLALGGTDGTVQVRDAATGRILFTVHGHLNHVWDVAWSPDGTRIASASWDKTVQIWDAATGRHLLTYRGHSDLVLAVAWSPDGKRIALLAAITLSRSGTRRRAGASWL